VGSSRAAEHEGSRNGATGLDDHAGMDPLTLTAAVCVQGLEAATMGGSSSVEVFNLARMLARCQVGTKDVAADWAAQSYPSLLGR
jgi:hypothetical protein